eukprot:scaffold240537_cov31-Tisochrysis_lutea.AAC.3
MMLKSWSSPKRLRTTLRGRTAERCALSRRWRKLLRLAAAGICALVAQRNRASESSVWAPVQIVVACQGVRQDLRRPALALASPGSGPLRSGWLQSAHRAGHRRASQLPLGRLSAGHRSAVTCCVRLCVVRLSGRGDGAPRAAEG